MGLTYKNLGKAMGLTYKNLGKAKYGENFGRELHKISSMFWGVNRRMGFYSKNYNRKIKRGFRSPGETSNKGVTKHL